jgi:hypothetical protein
LSGGTAELSNKDGKDNPDSLAQYKLDNPIGDQRDGGSNELLKDDALYTYIPTNSSDYNEYSDSGIGVDISASIG